jgi:uncharacterized protein YqeY
MSPSTREQMQADLMTALRGRDRAAVSVLRTTLAALANAEAVDMSPAGPTPVPAGLFADVERRLLSDGDVHAIVARERDELRSAAAEFDRLGRPFEAAHCRAQAALLAPYLAA